MMLPEIEGRNRRMLVFADHLRDLSFSALMTVYEQSNRESAKKNWPEESTDFALQLAEQEFYQYLRQVFFHTPGARYAIWLEHGIYVSALRLEPYRDGLLLSALETAPDYRKQGFAEALVREVLRTLPVTSVYSHIHKCNHASFNLHMKCGFHRISEQATYLDGSVDSKCCTVCYRGAV